MITAALLSFGVVACTSARGEPVPSPTCVRAWPEARYRPYGYDHIVHIHNACTETAACVVSTDVNPEPILATVPPTEEVEVLTFAGSPARTFTPNVWCQLRAQKAPPRRA
jgi:hypothetical protein